MPFKSLAHMSDAELDALFAFLKSLDARPQRSTHGAFGQRC